MTTEPITLSATDVDVLRSLRKRAKGVNDATLVMDWRRDRGYVLTVITRYDTPEGCEPTYIEKRVPITIDGRINNYSNISHTDYHRVVAMDSIYYSGPFNTGIALANLVRAGDQLHALFVLGNDNDNLKNAGLTHDQCTLAVVRGGRCIANMAFDDRVIPIGGLAGMIDRTYRPERDGGGL